MRVNPREDSSAHVWVRIAEVLKGVHTEEDQCSMVKKKCLTHLILVMATRM